MLKGIFTSFSGNHSKIAACYKYLDQYHSGLSKQIAEYIISGDDHSVLSSLKQITKKQFQEAGVWRPDDYRYYSSSKSAAKRIDHFSHSFATACLSGVLTDSQVFRRFGLVLAESMERPDAYHIHYSADDAPDWLVDILYLLPNVMLQKNQVGMELISTTFDGSWLQRALSENDIKPKTWLSILLERQNYYRDRTGFFDHLVASTKWEPIFQEQALTEIFEKLHFSGRESLIKYLLNYPYLDKQLDIVALLITDKSKQVREHAQQLLSKVNSQLFQQYILEHYDNYPAPRRKEIAQLISLFGDDNATQLLEHILQTEKSKSVVEIIHASIANKKAAKASQGRSIDVPDIIAISSNIALPDNWKSELNDKLVELITKAKEGVEEEEKYNQENGTKYSWQKNEYQRISKLTNKDINNGLAFLESGTGTFKQDLFSVFIKSNIQQQPEFKLPHIVRLLLRSRNNYDDEKINLSSGHFQKWLSAHPDDLTDLRQLSTILQEHNIGHRSIAQWLLRSRWESQFELPETGNILLWPFFYENEEYLQEAFGLSENKEQRYYNFEMGYGVLILSQFPVIPEHYLQVIYQHALSPAKTYGALCRKAIQDYGIVADRIIIALSSSKQEERIIAANWIAESQLSDAIEPLKTALKKEKRETAKAALLSALHELGQDISHHLSPDALFKEAETGLKKAMPKNLSWFPFNSLPELKWQSSGSVDNRIIQWWIILACKLKQPEGNPLVDLYLEQLTLDSQKALGLFILQIFVARDTACPSDTEAKEYAQENQQNRYDSYQHWAKYDWGKDYKDKTLEDAYKSLFMERKAEYLGSAIGEKGILCLIGYTEGAEAVQIVTRYMKDHYTRRHQIEAILSALANNNDPVVIQLLLSVARRHRTNSVLEKAKVLVEEIATRNNWTQDELADRTIPTAGLESNGTQTLQLGSRELTIKLSHDLKIVLENEQGKTLKSLPAARQDDDADQVKQAKKDFSTAKKELKQVIELQSSRLYEAMCIGRSWLFSEWQQYLLEHPIVTRLVQRAVWTVTDNEQRYQVRPTPELELIDLDDEEHEPSDSATIQLAHISDIDNDSASQWIQHFKEEKVKPLFLQFNRPSYSLTEKDISANKLDYHEGWVSDTFTLRGILTKRGYKRGEAEDGGYFSYYYKDFTALKLRAIIEFSGNCLPEENVPAVLYYLAFVQPQKGGWFSDSHYKTIKEVPPNLLNEIMLDYEAVAEKAHYDEDWRKKSPW